VVFALAQAAYEYPASNVNAALLSRARKRGTPVEFLDTWDDQTRYLDIAVTPVKLAAAIHDFPKLRCRLPERLVAFRAGDERSFINEIGPDDGHVVARIDGLPSLRSASVSS
jgi:hypothetical protein